MGNLEAEEGWRGGNWGGTDRVGKWGREEGRWGETGGRELTQGRKNENGRIDGKEGGKAEMRGAKR